MSGGVEVVVFPRIVGVQWSDTVESALWEGGSRRSRPGYRPWSCEDCTGRRAGPCVPFSEGCVTSPDPLPQREAGPVGRCRHNSNGNSAEPVLSCVVCPTVLLQHPGWRIGD